MTSGDHDAVRLAQDGVVVLQPLLHRSGQLRSARLRGMEGSASLTYLVLDLRDDLDVLAARAQHGPDGVDVAGLAHEAGRDEVHLVRHAELLQVLDVLHTAKQSTQHTQAERRSRRIGQGGRSAHLLRQRGQVHHRSCSHSTAQHRHAHVQIFTHTYMRAMSHRTWQVHVLLVSEAGVVQHLGHHGSLLDLHHTQQQRPVRCG